MYAKICDKRLKKEYDHLSKKDFLKKIDLDHGIKISTFTLKKIVEGEY